MDNLTHSLTGLMLARAGLGRLTPRAGLLAMLAANMPDVDVVSWFEGRARYLDVHRGYTHAWALVPLLALLPVLVARWSFSWPLWLRRLVGGDQAGWSWWKAWLASCVGVASHLLLDWTNNYGIRFGMPFDASWHRLDLLFVIDPWVWLLLLFGVAAPFLSRLVSSEIGARRTSGGGVAWFVLILLCGYVGGRQLLHERALGMLESRVYEGQNPRRVAAFPVFGNPLRWRVLAEVSNGYWISELNVLRELDPAEGRVYYQAEESPMINMARATTDFQAFLRFNQYPLWRVIPLAGPEGSARVELLDLRFGDPVSPGFVATFTMENGRAEGESIRFGTPKI